MKKKKKRLYEATLSKVITVFKKRKHGMSFFSGTLGCHFKNIKKMFLDTLKF